MRPSFLIMLAIGLVLMVLFWWKSYEVEDARLAEDAIVTGCAGGTPCPTSSPQCLTAHGLTTGLCTTACAADNQCAPGWCCPAAEGDTPRLCAPPTVCGRLMGL